VAIAFSVQHMVPVLADQEPMVARLMTHTWRDSAAARAPWLRQPLDVAMQSAAFEHDRLAFAADLMRTGKISQPRADTIAGYAVREAYRRRIPPALILGVMLTENMELRSTARSNVGAAGLMQIDGRAWVRTLGRFFGTNLRDDETNLRYGVFILGHLNATTPDSLGLESGWRRALLRYNGCVRGTNTRDCHKYPDKVRERVEKYALASCGERDFVRCVARPLWLSRSTEPMIAAAPVRASAASLGD
jgi:soluble lytic murein transglycosylase-like protein